MKAVVLAAGSGERFFPFNVYRPKPMFPICNRPLLEWVIGRITAADISEIGIVIGHRGGRIRNHFGDGSRFGCRIAYLEQSHPRGTAHAASAAAEHIGEDPVLVCHGDLFFSQDAIPRLLQSFAAAEGHGVAATHRTDDLGHHIQAFVDSGGRITSYTWKPRGGRGLALSGIYVFPNDVVRDLANTNDFVPRASFGIAPTEGQEICDVIPLLHAEGRPLIAAELDGPYYDMDYPWEPRAVSGLAVREMAETLREPRISPEASIDPDARISGPISAAKGVRIARDAYVAGPAWIGEDTQILEGTHIAPYTVIGDRCRLGPFAKVSGMVGPNCHITYLGEFGGIMLEEGRVTHQIQLSGIFGERAEIGAGTQVGTLRFDDGPVEVDVKGIRRRAPGFSGVLFGDYSRTGIGAMMMPGRIVGPCSLVGPGVVLTRNLAPHKVVLVKQELEEKDWSPEIYNR